MNAIRQAVSPIIAGVVVGCLTGYGSFVFGQGQLAERVEGLATTTEQLGERDQELAARDAEIITTLNRMDREGTQVSRQGAQQLAELKNRLDRMESQQAIAIAQNARNEALLLDLKARLRQ